VIAPGPYIRRETAISIVINTVLSLGFFLLVFGSADAVPVWGVGAYAFDFVPQSFMIALMSTLVPGLLTASRLRAGAVGRLDAPSRWPAALVPRAILLAIVSVVVGAGLAALGLLALGADAVPWGPALAAKLVFGAALAAVITPIGLRAALASR
jgi:hypothetical protein